MLGWILIAMLAAIVAAVLISELKVRLKYVREEANDEAVATLIGLFGLIYLRFRIPAVKLRGLLKGFSFNMENPNTPEGESQEQSYTTKELMRFYRKFKILLKYMLGYREWLHDTLSHVHVNKVRWRTHIGVGDAPETAVTTGIIWSLKSSLLGQALRLFKLEAKPELAVDPDFNRMNFRTELEVHAHMRLYRIVVAFTMLLLRVMREEGGLKAWIRILHPRQAAK